MAEKKELETMTRRVESVLNHLNPIQLPSSSSLVTLSTTSMNDKYHKIHGEVSSHEAEWRLACDESGKEFIDIIYEKAVGEGIAKVVYLEFLKFSVIVTCD